jgi:hypothetical protein
MTDDLTTKLSFRLNTAVLNALTMCAADEGYEPMAYIQKVLTRRAIESGFMADDEALKTQAYEELFEIAVKHSRQLYKQIPFTEHWTLRVFQHLMKDDEFRPKYEMAIGGDAYGAGLPGKTPLNMYLGWYIKNAIGAEPKMGADGKPMRVQVKNEPIQSYTLLLKGSGS